MKEAIILLFSIFITVSLGDKKCTGVTFGNRYAELSVLKEGINRIRDLVYNQNDHTIYFTYNLISRPPSSSAGYVTVGNREAGVIDGIKNARTIAVDQTNNVVFIGGSDGIYTLNDKKVPVKLPGVNDNIVCLFFKDGILYYTNHRRQTFKYENDGVLLPELHESVVDSFVIDNDDNILFTHNRTLFRVKVGTRAINIHEHYDVDFLTTDTNGNAFIGSNDGVYVYNKYKFNLQKVSDLRTLTDMTFNKINEPIYAVADKIIQLNFKPIACTEN